MSEKGVDMTHMMVVVVTGSDNLSRRVVAVHVFAKSADALKTPNCSSASVTIRLTSDILH